MHLDDELIQRLLDSELPAADEIRCREHLATCLDCRGRRDEAARDQRAVNELLGRLDHPAPRVEARALAERARERVGAWHSRPLVQAAGFILACGIVTAAYALPGSPLPRWVAGVAQWIGIQSGSRAPVEAPGRTIEAPGAGITVDPGRNLLIEFSSTRPADWIHVSLTDRAEVSVRAPSGAATFTSDAERLVIETQADSATFEIEIPRAAPRVEIRVGTRRLFLKDGARVTTESAADSAGPYRLRLPAP